MLSYLIKISLFQVIITFLIIYLSKKLNFLDHPGKRKKHDQPTPYTGGIILGITFLYIVFLTGYENNNLNLILSYGIFTALSGFLDDKYNFNPGTKLIIQVFPIYLLIDQNLFLTDLGYYEFFGFIQLGSFDVIFSILCCLFLINAFNYSDGIDGLISGISIIILISFSFFCYLFLSDKKVSQYLLTIALPFFIFIIFNLNVFKNFKIFLGDAGSNIAGFLISFIMIYLYKEENLHPSLLIWSVAYIVYEFLCVNIIRFKNEKKIFLADRDHMHYELKEVFKISEVSVLFILLTLNCIFILIGYMSFLNFGPDITLAFYVFFFFCYLLVRVKINSKI